jgi:hypothetical protein
MSYLVQMLGLTHQNFLSAATGIALAIALVRGFARSSMRTIGNFWVDVTRATLFVLLPIWSTRCSWSRGKKIEAREVKMAMLAILVLPLMYLGLDRGRRGVPACGGDRSKGGRRVPCAPPSGQSRSIRVPTGYPCCSLPSRWVSEWWFIRGWASKMSISYF